MASPFWRHPGTWNGRVDADTSSLVSALSSYYYGTTGIYTLYGYVSPSYEYQYYYYEGYSYYSGHIWCAGDVCLPDIRVAVGETAGVYQDLINDLTGAEFLQYMVELLTHEDTPRDARVLLSNGGCSFVTSGAIQVAPADDCHCIVLPDTAVDFFEPADAERLVQVSGSPTNDGVYRISAIPWNQGRVKAAPDLSAGEYYNGQVALLEAPALAVEAPGAGVTVTMLGLRWTAYAYYDTDCRNYLDESESGRAWPRTMHVHFSKAIPACRTLTYFVMLRAVDTSEADVAAATGLYCMVPAPALYLDELYIIDTSAHLAVLNNVPQHDETGVPYDETIKLHVCSFDAGQAITSVTVYITRSSTGIRQTAYTTGGGFQAPWNGSLSFATAHMSPSSVLNDELWMCIDCTEAFTSMESLLVEVEMANALNSEYYAYSFTVEDLTAPTISEILWLSPRKARIKFSEVMDVSDDPGSILFVERWPNGVEIIAANQIRVPGTVDEDWVGLWISMAGSDVVNAGPFQISSVDVAARILVVSSSSLVIDDGVDRDESSIVVRRRDISGVISPYSFTARLSEEGLAYDETSAERIQCSFLPIPVSAALPLQDELPAGEDINQYVYVEFDDDISFGRLYRVYAKVVKDAAGNTATSTYLDFQSPTFGAPVERHKLWANGFIAGQDRKDDLEASGYLRKLAVIIQDLLNSIWYRVDELQHIEDPYRCPADWLDHLLYEYGNPWRFPLDLEATKRKLANALPGFYKKVGTAKAVKDMLRLLLGIEFRVYAFTEGDYWIIGTSVLGVETILGPGTAWARNAWELWCPVDDLTQAEEGICWAVGQWTDPANKHMALLVQGGGSIGGEHWILGVSALGISTWAGP